MRTSLARARCPAAVVVDAMWEANVAASRALFAIFERSAPVVQAGSMEEAFLHVPGSVGAAAEVAARLRREVREELELPLSVGVARTKVLAKIASRSAKPNGCFVVVPEREEAFLHPLPVERLWGVGPATAGRLHAHGLVTVGQAAARSEAELMAMLGKAAGRYVHAVAHNRDPPPVTRRRERGGASQRARAVPGVVPLERGVEVVHADEVLPGVVRLGREEAQLDHREHHVAHVLGAADAPVLQHLAREHAEPLDGQVAHRARELGAGHVPALGPARLRVLQRREHEQVPPLVEAGLAQPDLVHDAVAERQL